MLQRALLHLLLVQLLPKAKALTCKLGQHVLLVLGCAQSRVKSLHVQVGRCVCQLLCKACVGLRLGHTLARSTESPRRSCLSAKLVLRHLLRRADVAHRAVDNLLLERVGELRNVRALQRGIVGPRRLVENVSACLRSGSLCRVCSVSHYFLLPMPEDDPPDPAGLTPTVLSAPEIGPP